MKYGGQPFEERIHRGEQMGEAAFKMPLKKEPIVVRYELQSLFLLGISAVTDRRYSQKRQFQQLPSRVATGRQVWFPLFLRNEANLWGTMHLLMSLTDSGLRGVLRQFVTWLRFGRPRQSAMYDGRLQG
jgi:hypothetical protein